MKYAKFIILFVGVCLALGVCGELNQYDIYGFISQYTYIDTAYDEVGNYRAFVKQLIESCEENEVGVIAKSEYYSNDGRIQVNIYCNERMKKKLRSEQHYYEGIYDSLIYEKRVVRVEDISELLALEKDIPGTFSFCGEEKKIASVYKEVYEKGYVSYLNSGYDSSERDIVILLWIMVDGIFLLLVLFDVLSSRKENFVLITLGVRQNSLVIKNSLLDCLGCVGVYILSERMLSKVYFLNMRTIHSVALVGLCLGCVLIHVLCSKTNVKKAYKQVQVSSEVVRLFDVLKILVAVMSTAMLVVLMSNIQDEKHTKAFLSLIQKQEKYSFVTMEARNKGNYEDFIEYVAPIVDKYYDEVCPIYILCNPHTLLVGEKEFHIINVSYYARTLFNDVRYQEKENSAVYTVYIPQSLDWSDERILEDDEFLQAIYDEAEQNEMEIVRYQEQGRFLCFGGGESVINLLYDKAPIIIVHNEPESGEAVAAAMREWGDVKLNVMMQCQKGEGSSFLEELEGAKYTPITLDAYVGVSELIHRQEKRITVLLVTVSLFVFYDVLLALYLSKLEYMVYKRQIAIKRIVGCNMIERYARLFVRTVGVYVFSMLIVGLLSLSFEMIPFFACVKTVGAFMCLELILCIQRMWYLEKSNLKNDLSGGIYG